MYNFFFSLHYSVLCVKHVIDVLNILSISMSMTRFSFNGSMGKKTEKKKLYNF